MGNIIASQCKHCNYENSFKYGGSRMGHLTNRPIPAINMESGKFESVNYIEHEKNPKYVFYTSAKLKGDNENNDTINNFSLQLNTVNNFCPKCNSFSLSFRVTHYCD
ncbi:hypothetical protein [Flavobacterium sp.]|jgi:hypothetical protein|uniref:hypothetical protein n=1 Tax=Flavobacterium sp. TaxID=239 RepID=UPI0037BE8416